MMLALALGAASLLVINAYELCFQKSKFMLEKM